MTRQESPYGGENDLPDARAVAHDRQKDEWSVRPPRNCWANVDEPPLEMNLEDENF